jgi:hypothetical protein
MKAAIQVPVKGASICYEHDGAEGTMTPEEREREESER